MNKWSSVAVSAALAVAGVGASVSAEAHPYLTVGIDVPPVAVVGRFGHGSGARSGVKTDSVDCSVRKPPTGRIAVRSG
jgi:hypothetical protein